MYTYVYIYIIIAGIPYQFICIQYVLYMYKIHLSSFLRSAYMCINIHMYIQYVL